MINPLDPAAEKERQNELTDRTADFIRSGMEEEFIRLSSVIFDSLMEQRPVSAEEWAVHEVNVYDIITDGSDRIITRMIRDAVGFVPSRKGWQDYLRKADGSDNEEEEVLISALLVLLYDRITQQWASERLLPMAQEISATTRRQANALSVQAVSRESEAISEFVAGQGDGTVSIPLSDIRRQTAEQLRQEFINSTRARASTIGQTEAGAAGSMAANAAAAEVIDRLYPGTEPTKTWVSRQDNRVRSIARGDEFSHVDANGQNVPASGLFQIPRKGGGTEALRYPRDNNGSAANTIGCRCVNVFYVGDS